VVIGGILLVVAGAVAGGFALRGNGSPGVGSANPDPTSVATVAQESITSQTQVDATLGYTGSYSIVGTAQGTITWLPAIGQVVSRGQTLYDINGSPVVLLYGATPAYRNLSEGESGADVEQLNYDLVALGEYSSGETAPSGDTFTAATEYGVKKLQAALGVTQSGTLSLGQFVFEPTAVRITADGTNTVLGGPAQPGSTLLTGTSTGRVVTIDLDADEQSEVAVGDSVTITLPDNETTPGTVTSVGTVATTPSDDGSPGDSSSPTITVLVAPTDPSATGSLDQAPVEVTITTASEKNALVVPVDALLALSDGGYGIEVIGAKGVHTIEPVSLGLFDDAADEVAVTGSGIQAGQRIVIPASS
jgi:hypothetical protein